MVKEIPAVTPVSDFPSDVLKWIKRNNSKPKTILKFMRICRYFQLEEFPFSAVINLWGACRQQGQPLWAYQPLESNVKSCVKDFPKPLWILDCLRLTKFDILPKVAVCELYSLVLAEVDMSFTEFQFLTAPGKVSQLSLSDSVIRDNESGKILPFQTIFQCLPNINSHNFANSFFYYEEGAKFDQFNNIREEPRKEPYKIEECFAFFQKNQHIFFNFSIYGPRDDEFTQRLQTATDNLLKELSPKNKPPVIYFLSQTPKLKYDLKKLQSLFEKQQQK